MDLYEAIEIICDDYCKYPDAVSGNKLADICDKCPMNRCEDLRWADRKTENSSEKPNNCDKDIVKACDNCKYRENCDDAVFAYRGFTKRCLGYAPDDEPQSMYYPQVDGITPTVITEDRDTQILDAWQVKLKAEQTQYKKWDAPPKVDLPTGEITTCVSVLASALKGKPQTERACDNC